MSLGEALKHTGFGTVNYWRDACEGDRGHLHGHNDWSDFSGQYAKFLAESGMWGHSDPGCRPGQAENIYQEIAPFTCDPELYTRIHNGVKDWVDSWGEHRENMLRQDLTHMGIGTHIRCFRHECGLLMCELTLVGRFGRT